MYLRQLLQASIELLPTHPVSRVFSKTRGLVALSSVPGPETSWRASGWGKLRCWEARKGTVAMS